MTLTDLKKALGLLVYDARHRRGLTQEDLAGRINKSPNTISNIERGESAARIETLHQIAEALEVPVEELFRIDTRNARDRSRRELIERLTALLADKDEQFILATIEQIEILARVNTPKPKSKSL